MSSELSAPALAAVEAIQAGELVVLPTDTVYGLCASPLSAGPARRLYRLKGRPEPKPTALVCCDLSMLLECVPELRGRPAELAEALLPGPYTLILPNPARRFPWLSGAASETIGVRIPRLRGEVAGVLDRVGAVTATSANLAGGPEPRRLEEVPEKIRAASAACLDGGELPGTPSTVVDLTTAEPRILREGAVPAAEALARVRSVLGPGSKEADPPAQVRSF